MTKRYPDRRARENCCRWREEDSRSLGARMSWACLQILTAGGLRLLCSSSPHRPAHLHQEGQHREKSPEDRTGQRNLARCAPALPLFSHSHRGSGASLPGAAAASGGGRGPRPAFSPWDSLPLSGCWCIQNAEFILTSHYCPKQAFQELWCQAIALTNIMLSHF